jgi:CRP/FNR family transcriptional regulator, cyclic AMP receptor protein
VPGLGAMLGRHPFFADVDPADLDQVVGCAMNVRFAAGQYLSREGEAADRFYIVRDGRVALEVYAPGRGPVVVDTAESGEIVGLSWLFPPHTWQLDARAVVPVRAVAIDGACLRAKCDQNTRLGYLLMQRLSSVAHRRMQSARMRLIDLYGDSRTG